MKHILFLFILLVFFVSLPGVTEAAQIPPVSMLQQQILMIKEQIARLTSAIANLRLQKEVSSDSYLVINISDNSIISQKNIDQVYPIASITKLMNAVVATENVDMNATIALDSDMLKPEGFSPSLFLHENISAKNLLQASLIQSTNDASEALSYFVGNEKFITLMNEKAKELGMENTYFYDAHGLSPKNHSTASDLAKLLGYIYNHHPEILSITKENDFWLPDITGKLLKFQNVNNLYQNPDFIGAKSGYLPEAKQTLASVAIIEGKPVTVVLLRSKNRWSDALKIIEWTKLLKRS